MTTRNKVVLSLGVIAILAGGFAMANAVKKGGNQRATTVCEDTNGVLKCKTTGGEGAGSGKTECAQKGAAIECTTTVK
jgi:hypothetical protein